MGIVNRPFTSAEAPIEVPAMRALAPMRVSPVAASVTVPTMRPAKGVAAEAGATSATTSAASAKARILERRGVM